VSPGDSSSAETTRDCLATDYHLMGASGADDSAVVCADGGRCTVDVYLEDGDLVVEGCQIEITTEL